jgi:hypothetical protein
MKILLVGAELFYADRQTDVMLTVTFRRFTKVPNNNAESAMLQCRLCASIQILNDLNESLHDACRKRYAIAGHRGNIISNLTPCLPSGYRINLLAPEFGV